MTVSVLSSVKFHNTSIIKHHHHAHQFHHCAPQELNHQPPQPPAPHHISIHLLHCIADSVYIHHFTHAAPHAAVPFVNRDAPPAPHRVHVVGQPHPHVLSRESICVVDVHAVHATFCPHQAPHGAHLPEKSNVQLVKLASQRILICTMHHVGVTVNVLVAPPAARDE